MARPAESGLAPLARSLSALALGTATTVILVIVALRESMALRRIGERVGI